MEASRKKYPFRRKEGPSFRVFSGYNQRFFTEVNQSTATYVPTASVVRRKRMQTAHLRHQLHKLLTTVRQLRQLTIDNCYESSIAN